MSNDCLLPTANNGAIVAAGSATDDFIKSRIFTIRGVQVMLDRDLAVLYGIETRALNQAVKRNADRFPPDLMFQVETAEVINALEPSEPQATPSRSQFVTLNNGRGKNIKYRPNAFTEHGIIMLASVLRSEQATQASLIIVRTFVAMRKALASVAPLLARMDTLERRQITDQTRNEERFETIFKAMDGGWEQCCQCESVASSQFQLPMSAKLVTGNIGIGNIGTMATLPQFQFPMKEAS